MVGRRFESSGLGGDLMYIVGGIIITINTRWRGESRGLQQDLNWIWFEIAVIDASGAAVR